MLSKRQQANVVSISGGKDSTALALLAIEREAESLVFAFADTGHEHPQTYEYIAYLDGVLKGMCGVGITTARADFSKQIERKRRFVESAWREQGVPESIVESALSVLQPTGSPFLDLCLWKGRFPSTRARFCTTELKHMPINEQVIQPLMAQSKAVISWQGVRADESPSRANLPERDVEMGSWDPEPAGLLIYRPIIRWSAQDAFDQHRKHGVRWNPLYEQGMSRVGCMPCIHANKSEMREIAKRFPEQVERVAEWESLVAQASKRGLASFFANDKVPGQHESLAISQVADWALTGRGGRQYDLIHVAQAGEESPSCSSVYGLCE